MIKVLLPLLFIGLANASDEVILDKVINEQSVKVIRNFDEGNLNAKIVIDDKDVKHYKKSYVTEKIKSTEIYGNKYLVISFQKGVHGEHFQVWDIAQKKSLLDFKSIWPIQINDSKKSLKITYFDYLKGRPQGLRQAQSFSY